MLTSLASGYGLASAFATAAIRAGTKISPLTKKEKAGWTLEESDEILMIR